MNKLGPHVIESTPAGLAWSRAAPIVKGLANLDPLRQARDDAVRIFRPDAYNLDLNDTVGIAGHVLNGLQGYRHRNLYADPWNERHPTMAQIKAVVDVLHANEVKVAGCSWGTGDYTALDWEAAVQAGVDAISVHCYWDPEKLDVYEAYRYRMFWEAGDPPVVITECGRRHGYHDLEELLGYEVNISKDPYVLGATVFCTGPWYYPGVDPQAFNVDPLVPQLIREGASVVPTSWTLGVDLSNNNPRVDFGLLARTRQFALLKATEGGVFVDPTFTSRWDACAAVGLVRGAYLFARPSQGSGASDAAHFLANVRNPQPGDIAIIDLEDDRVAPQADLRAYLIDCASHIKTVWDVPPLIYSTAGYLRIHNCTYGADLLDCGLWIASWWDTLPTDLAGWPFAALWQFTSEGHVPGVGGKVDEDVFHGSLDLLRKYGKP